MECSWRGEGSPSQWLMSDPTSPGSVSLSCLVPPRIPPLCCLSRCHYHPPRGLPLLAEAGRKALLGKAMGSPLLPFVASSLCPHFRGLPHQKLGVAGEGTGGSSSRAPGTGRPPSSFLPAQGAVPGLQVPGRRGLLLDPAAHSSEFHQAHIIHCHLQARRGSSWGKLALPPADSGSHQLCHPRRPDVLHGALCAQHHSCPPRRCQQQLRALCPRAHHQTGSSRRRAPEPPPWAAAVGAMGAPPDLALPRDLLPQVPDPLQASWGCSLPSGGAN